MAKSYEFTLIATAKITVHVKDNQDGFDALLKARTKMLGKEILLADPDEDDSNFTIQNVSESGTVKVANIILGEYTPD